MSDLAVIDQAPRPPALVAGARVQAIVPSDFDGAWRIANAVVKAGMAPKGVETAEKAMVCIMHGMEVGLPPMMALQSIAPINGRPAIYGDGALGLVQGSGLMEWYEETFEGDNENADSFKAICIVKRKGDAKPKRGEFSIADAKLADLFGKSGPWKQYRKRMLKMRARAFALRDGFSDVLRGLHIAEEAQDIPEIDAVELPPAPPASAALIPPSAPKRAKPEGKPRGTRAAVGEQAQSEAEDVEREADRLQRQSETPETDEQGDYLAMMLDEYRAAKVPAARAGIAETFLDSVSGALERGEIDAERASELRDEWDAKTNPLAA